MIWLCEYYLYGFSHCCILIHVNSCRLLSVLCSEKSRKQPCKWCLFSSNRSASPRIVVSLNWLSPRKNTKWHAFFVCPKSCVECDNITKVCIVEDHLSISPEYVGNMLLTIQLQGILEWWVLSNFIMEILQHISSLSKSQFPLTSALQIIFAVTTSVAKVKWFMLAFLNVATRRG